MIFIPGIPQHLPPLPTYLSTFNELSPSPVSLCYDYQQSTRSDTLDCVSVFTHEWLYYFTSLTVQTCESSFPKHVAKERSRMWFIRKYLVNINISFQRSENHVRKSLHYGQDKTYRPEIPLWKSWNFQHQPPGAERPLPQSTNTMPDLATAMKYNPDLRILLTGGYFDLATPYYEGWYRDAPPPNPGAAPGPHRLSLLSVGPHGVHPPGIAQGSTR